MRRLLNPVRERLQVVRDLYLFRWLLWSLWNAAKQRVHVRLRRRLQRLQAVLRLRLEAPGLLLPGVRCENARIPI